MISYIYEMKPTREDLKQIMTTISWSMHIPNLLAVPMILLLALTSMGCQGDASAPENGLWNQNTPSYESGSNDDGESNDIEGNPIRDIVDGNDNQVSAPLGPGAGQRRDNTSDDEDESDEDEESDDEEVESDEDAEDEESAEDESEEELEEELPEDELLRWQEFESQVFDIVNQRREENGLQPLEKDNHLREAAYLHSKDMVEKGYFSHTGQDGSNFAQRVRRTDYSGQPGGENIASGQPTPESVMESWMNSPGHRANILRSSFRYIGVGVHQGGQYGAYTWTQVFGS